MVSTTNWYYLRSKITIIVYSTFGIYLINKNIAASQQNIKKNMCMPVHIRVWDCKLHVIVCERVRVLLSRVGDKWSCASYTWLLDRQVCLSSHVIIQQRACISNRTILAILQGMFTYSSHIRIFTNLLLESISLFLIIPHYIPNNSKL